MLLLVRVEAMIKHLELGLGSHANVVHLVWHHSEIVVVVEVVVVVVIDNRGRVLAALPFTDLLQLRNRKLEALGYLLELL